MENDVISSNKNLEHIQKIKEHSIVIPELKLIKRNSTHLQQKLYNKIAQHRIASYTQVHLNDKNQQINIINHKRQHSAETNIE